MLYERGAFSPQTTTSTARALAVYGLGLPAFVMIRVFAPGYFAREDTRTPMIFAAISAAVNVACALTLFPLIAEAGIAGAEVDRRLDQHGAALHRAAPARPFRLDAAHAQECAAHLLQRRCHGTGAARRQDRAGRLRPPAFEPARPGRGARCARRRRGADLPGPDADHRRNGSAPAPPKLPRGGHPEPSAPGPDLGLARTGRLPR